MNLKHCKECNRMKIVPPGKTEPIWLPRPPCFNPKPGVTIEQVQCPECRVFGEFPAIKFIRETMQNAAIHACISLMTNSDKVATRKTSEDMVRSAVCAAIAALGRTLTDEEVVVLNTGLTPEECEARINPILEAWEKRKQN